MRRPRYRSYMLGLLTVLLAFNFTERLTLGLLMQPIKTELGLSDTQLGLLSGIAFAAFYSLMGIPLARWADRGDRRVLLTLTTALWSAAVSLCAFAGNFVQLMAVRIGVAIGEAGCLPTAHSLIADNFNREERPRAVARFMMGNPLSLLFGYFVAGWLNQFYGWRTTFFLLGLPGLLLAAIIWFTLRESRRKPLAGRSLPEPGTPAPPAAGIAETADGDVEPTMAEIGRALGRNRTFRHLLLAYAVTYFFGYGIGKWQPAFFMRSFALQTGELGSWFALCGLAGVVGIYAGGELATRLAPNDEARQLRAAAWICAASGIISAAIYLAPSAGISFLLLGLSFIAFNLTSGPVFAAIQSLVPDRMRAVAIASVYLFANLIGMGLGPLAAGMVSDALHPMFGEESLRYALVLLCPGYFWAAWHMRRASRTVTTDMAAAVKPEGGS